MFFFIETFPKQKKSFGSTAYNYQNIEGLGEMFEGDSANMLAGKCPLVSMGGQAEGLACVDTGRRTPICASGSSYNIYSLAYPTWILYTEGQSFFRTAAASWEIFKLLASWGGFQKLILKIA